MLKQFFDPETSTLSYLLVDSTTQQAVMIDPVLGQEEQYLQVIDELNITLAWIVENGHRVSSVAQEKLLNPRIKDLNRAGFIELMDSLELPKPKKIDIAVPANMVCGHNSTDTGDTLSVPHAA